MPVKGLKPAALYRRCPTSSFGFRSTAELADLDGVLGQDRAVEALTFGIGIRRDGYNLFVLGPPGTGRHSMVRDYLQRRAASEPTPDEWVYVNNFTQPHRPNALALPPGRAAGLKRDMERLVEDLQAAIPALFESDEFRTRLQAIEEEFKEAQEAAFKNIQVDANKRNLALVRTPMGFALAPMRGNEVMPPDEFNKLPEAVRTQIEQDIEELQVELQAVVRKIPDWERDRRAKIRDLTREMTRLAVAGQIAELKRAYDGFDQVIAYFAAVEHDIAESVDAFMPQEQQQMAPGQGPARVAAALRRYQVTPMMDGERPAGAPVISEELPTQPNLVGRVEHQAEMGALLTDFTMIKPGALHRANGGYLVLDALRLLQQPYAWESLKRALRGRHINVESLGQMLSLISTVSLDPEPIPLDVKVVLIGDRRLYYLLCAADPDFPSLFKVMVDFEEQIDLTPETTLGFARLLAGVARRGELRPLDKGGVARVVEHAGRMAGDADKVSVQVGHLADLLREADYFAGNGGRKLIGRDDVQQAIDAAVYRANRAAEQTREAIIRDTVLIDTDGAKLAQINGLAVYGLGNFSFGRPSRITARVRMGTGEVVDIERRVELGGPLHSKGVLILSAFLGARFAADHPLSLSASLVFEQSYGGVDGDSASSAECYVLMSALSGLQIDQGLAVTGSVNQHGEVQAIGGVNEKIEGFFDICADRGLTGRQGVLIPASNVKHLMLRRDVVDAVRQGRFNVYPVTTIDEGIELLTGRRAGAPRKDGSYPPDSVNRLVQDRLLELAEKRRKFGARRPEEPGNDANADNAKAAAT